MFYNTQALTYLFHWVRMFLKPSIFEWVKKLSLMKCLSLPPCDMFAEQKEVYMTQKINQRVQICKTVRCSNSNRVVYLDFFYLGSNRTNLFIQCFSFLRLWLLLLKKSLVENFFFEHWLLLHTSLERRPGLCVHVPLQSNIFVDNQCPHHGKADDGSERQCLLLC